MDILFVDDERSILDQAKIFLEEEDDSLDIEALSSAERGFKEVENPVLDSDYT